MFSGFNFRAADERPRRRTFDTAPGLGLGGRAWTAPAHSLYNIFCGLHSTNLPDHLRLSLFQTHHGYINSKLINLHRRLTVFAIHSLHIQLLGLTWRVFSISVCCQNHEVASRPCLPGAAPAFPTAQLAQWSMSHGSRELVTTYDGCFGQLRPHT